MYGLKEKAIAKLLLRVVKIDRNSDDGYNLLNWKLPGKKSLSSMAGDFAGRCYEVLQKRPMRTEIGDMTIDEVNESLNKLSMTSKEEQQVPIIEDFYKRMNPEELTWLIRIILRQMKIGATEKTILDIWHKHADLLFNVSSNLRRVCWELYDPNILLEGDETNICLMQCFQPQLAQFQLPSYERMVQKLKPTETDDEFWIEEKLDGERMQLHMMEDDSICGGSKFGFWSRKAKDYTYLYGEGFDDGNSALTRHLKTAFHEGVRNLILDGEMVTWSPETGRIGDFGHLKTAALEQQRNPFSDGARPLYVVFDILYLNDQPLTSFTLRDRRNALSQAVRPMKRRFEVHTYTSAHKATDIDPALSRVVTQGLEGLVLKSPRSAYRLNERNDDWFKVKPEYMTEYNEDLDCIIIGGYYGSGHRGGVLSSFLCGLRVNRLEVDKGRDPLHCHSFFKVGGGFTAGDYATIRHKTDGKWHDWDKKNPPTKYIELGGGQRQFECPDVWIRPDESVVVSVKGASIHTTPQFRTGSTLRFPRFKAIRNDKDFKTAMDLDDFKAFREKMKNIEADKKATFEHRRKRNKLNPRKKVITVAGAATAGEDAAFDAPRELSEVFSSLKLCIMTESSAPHKKSKPQLEAWAKGHGAKITQNPRAEKETIVIADRNVVKVASMQKEGKQSVIRPAWLFDCVAQAGRDIALGRTPLLLPYEPKHVLFVCDRDKAMVGSGADEYGDGYARDVASVEGMRALLDGMPSKYEAAFDPLQFTDELTERGEFDPEDFPGFMFRGCVGFFDPPAGRSDGTSTERAESDGLSLDLEMAERQFRFAGGKTSHLEDTEVTHVILLTQKRAHLDSVRNVLAGKARLPRIVTTAWIWKSWKEGTRLDEERFAPVCDE